VAGDVAAVVSDCLCVTRLPDFAYLASDSPASISIANAICGLGRKFASSWS
jgi:hypothetical protein